MNSRGLLTLCFLLAPAAAQAQDNRPDVGAIGSSVTDILTMVTLGLLTNPTSAAHVTPDGSDYLVRLPLRGFSFPVNAVVNAAVHPINNGMWNVTSMTLPIAGTIGTVPADNVPNQVSYSLGGQAIHGTIDPTFAHPSAFAASLAGITLHFSQDDRHSKHSLERYRTDGTVIGNGAGQLDFESRNHVADWRLIIRDPNASSAESTVRTVSGRISVHGLNRAKGTQLATALRALIASPDAPAVEQPSPAQRQQRAAAVDALAGLLTRLETTQRLDDIRFSLGPDNNGSVGRISLNATIDAAGEAIDARTHIAMDKVSSSLAPPDTAPYLPRHVDVVPIMTGVRPAPLMAFLRAAVTQEATQAELLARFTALFSGSDARIGVKSLAFDCGPMQVTGWAWVAPRATGRIGVDIHLSAVGVDALMAQAQNSPTLRQALPMIFLAKGIGRQENGAVVWDISVGDGLLTVNGFPFGQPPAFSR